MRAAQWCGVLVAVGLMGVQSACEADESTAPSKVEPSIQLEAWLDEGGGRDRPAPFHVRVASFVEVEGVTVHCQLPEGVSFLGEQPLLTVEEPEGQTVTLWEGAMEPNQTQQLDGELLIPDDGLYEIVIEASAAIPDSDWRMANAVLVRIKEWRQEPIPQPQRLWKDSGAPEPQVPLGAEPLREEEEP